MSFVCSGSELSALVRAAAILLSPVDFEDTQRWQRDACRAKFNVHTRLGVAAKLIE